MSTVHIDGTHNDRPANPPAFLLLLYHRFFWAATGGGIAMGLYTFNSYRDDLGLLIRQRLSLAVGVGLPFGICIGILVLLAAEIPTQLRSRWSGKGWLLGGIVCGAMWGTLTWAAYQWFIYYWTGLAWGVLLFGGIGLAVGFSIVDWVSLPGWVSVLLPAVTIYVPIWLTAQGSLTGNGLYPLLYFEQMSPVFIIGIPMALLISLGGTLPVLWRRRKHGTPINRMI